MAPVVERRKKIQFAKGNVYDGQPFEGIRWVEPKYDGLRGGVIVRSMNVWDEWQWVGEAMTLTGLPIPNASIVVDEIVSSNRFNGMMLDGEFRADDWSLSQSIVKSQKQHPEIDKLHFHVFDLLTVEEWDTKTCTRPLHTRKAELLKLMQHAWPMPHVRYVHHEEVSNAAEARNKRRLYVAGGFEGTMLKDPTQPYAFKKSNAWLKDKPIHEADFEITGAVEGRGKHKGMLGALKIKSEELAVKSEVGTGFDDQQRKELWADFMYGKLIGRLVQVEYQEITEDMALRFPSFMRMRDDKQ